MIEQSAEHASSEVTKGPDFKPTIAEIVTQLRIDSGITRTKAREQLYGVIKAKLTIESQSNPYNFIYAITEDEMKEHGFSSRSKTVQNIVFEIAKTEGILFSIVDNKDFYFEVMLKDETS